jgi:hypothetical protein
MAQSSTPPWRDAGLDVRQESGASIRSPLIRRKPDRVRRVRGRAPQWTRRSSSSREGGDRCRRAVRGPRQRPRHGGPAEALQLLGLLRESRPRPPPRGWKPPDPRPRTSVPPPLECGSHTNQPMRSTHRAMRLSAPAIVVEVDCRPMVAAHALALRLRVAGAIRGARGAGDRLDPRDTPSVGSWREVG